MSNNVFWTISGKEIDILNVRAEDVSVNDIAHSLSLMCRFNGHIPYFYSVAEHSLLVSKILTDELKIDGLFHDGSESFFGDIISPVKKQFQEIVKVEDGIMKTISEVIGFQFPEHPDVKIADRTILRYELEVFFPEKFKILYEDKNSWVFRFTNPEIGDMVYKFIECPRKPEEIKDDFLREYKKLCLQSGRVVVE